MDKELKRKLIAWIAEYSYSKANKGKVGNPPSIVYEQVEKDFDKFLEEEEINN